MQGKQIARIKIPEYKWHVSGRSLLLGNYYASLNGVARFI